MDPLKLIITSKANLKAKYASKFTAVSQLLSKLVKADKARKLRTEVVYLDDAASMKKYGVPAIKDVSPRNCKNAVDKLFKKHAPAYIVIFGAQDVIPFQSIDNPTDDEDVDVPSDLPYACTVPFNKKITAFTGPTRVVGRIPDVPGQPDLAYVTTVINAILKHKPIAPSLAYKYFSVTAKVWQGSTELSLESMFGNADDLLTSPPAEGGYTKTQLKPLFHFYNCHGAPLNPNFYGQDGNNYPPALHSKHLDKKVSFGTVVAAECCYGAEINNPAEMPKGAMTIASNYLLNSAVAFVGSSTIAYGPADAQGLADLITQFFIKRVLEGASTGRALLEARQEFLTKSGPELDPYELKTIAQFYLLGDPSLTPVMKDKSVMENSGKSFSNTLDNRRLTLFKKGENLKKSIAPSTPVAMNTKTRHKKELRAVLRKTHLDTAGTQEHLYAVQKKTTAIPSLRKGVVQAQTKYRTFVKRSIGVGRYNFKVLVVKESQDEVVGWRVYVSR